MNTPNHTHLAAVIGAGPAGLFAARELAANGTQVFLFNRDVHAGGLAEYGIYFNKYKMKAGLRAQFQQILATPGMAYYGNVRVGVGRDLAVDELHPLGFQAVLVCSGAQENRRLGLEGESLAGVYHANQLVYCYNQMPPICLSDLPIGRRAVIMGVGNVMTDVACYLIHEKKVEEVTVMARRGPGEIKFEKKEFERIAACLDMDDLDVQFQRYATAMQALGQDAIAARQSFVAAKQAAPLCATSSSLKVRFMSSLSRLVGDEQGHLSAVVAEKNTLARKDGEVRPVGTGEFETMQADTLVLAIGNRVDPGLGLPLNGYEYHRHPKPCYPVEETCYEAFDPAASLPLAGIFLGGWARQASTGLVGQARKDGINAARAVLAYLRDLPEAEPSSVGRIQERLAAIPHPLCNTEQLFRLQSIEAAKAKELGVEAFKFSTDDEIFAAMG